MVSLCPHPPDEARLSIRPLSPPPRVSSPGVLLPNSRHPISQRVFGDRSFAQVLSPRKEGRSGRSGLLARTSVKRRPWSQLASTINPVGVVILYLASHRASGQKNEFFDGTTVLISSVA